MYKKPHVYSLYYSTGNIIEYSMIEFQGDLETKSEESLGGKLIGDLHFNHEVN